MTRKFFGTDGIRGLTNGEPMTAADGASRRPWRPARISCAATTATGW